MLKVIGYCSVYLFMAALTSCGTDNTKDGQVDTADTVMYDHATLRSNVDSIAKTIDGKVGFATMLLETGDTFSYNGTAHMPMQSTYKFPLALMVMDGVDKGLFTLEQKVHISKAEMPEETHSPIRDKYGARNLDVTLHEILDYTTAMSDNIGCDVMFRLVGGPQRVDSFVHAKGFKGINIISTEAELHEEWTRQYDNWTEPVEMVNILAAFYRQEIISKTATDTLRNMMERTTGGVDRIKGLLPQGTVVAHKTGTGGMADGLNRAVNDVGVITLPNGKHLALAIYVADAHAETPACEAVMAKMAKAAYDTYSK